MLIGKICVRPWPCRKLLYDADILERPRWYSGGQEPVVCKSMFYRFCCKRVLPATHRHVLHACKHAAHVHVCLGIHTGTYRHIYMYIYHIYIHICMFRCIYWYIERHMPMCSYILINIHTYMHISTHTHIYIYMICICLYLYAHIHERTHTHAHMHISTHL